MTDNINILLVDMPTTIYSFVRKNLDGYTIVLNARLSQEDRLRHYQHELDHILNGDFEKDLTADEIEAQAHRKDCL